MENYPDYKIEPISDFIDLFNRFSLYDEKIAFVSNKRNIKYSTFIENVKAACNYLKSFSNEYICLEINDKYLYVVALFAVLLSGNTAVLKSNLIKQPTFCKTKLTDEDIRNNISTNIKNFEPIINIGVSVVLFSSGTTTEPKAIALSTKNIISNLLAGMEKYEFPQNGRYVNIIPFYHAFGLTCELLTSLYSGSTLYLSENIVDFLLALPTFNPTALNVTPGIVDLLINKLDNSEKKSDVLGDSLKKILSGGAATSSEACVKMREYGVNVYGSYGLSECSPGVCINRDRYFKDGSVGIVANCNYIEFYDENKIRIKGTNVYMGYLKNNGEIKESNGYIDTEDIGYIDKDGFLYILGRADELLIFSDGRKLMPQSIEEKINHIKGVIESIVYKCNELLYTTVRLENGVLVDKVSPIILNLDFNGFKISKVKYIYEPLERNQLGKLCRKNYIKQ